MGAGLGDAERHHHIIVEDPVTGSLNAGLAQWLVAAGRLPARNVAAQGRALCRAGRVHVDADTGPNGPIWVGGDALLMVTGELGL